MLAFDLNEDPGTGNLSARAYVASIVGPRRIAHGQRVVKRLPIGGAQPQSVAKNGTPSKTVTYFEIWLPQRSLALPGGGVLATFSSSPNSGESSFQLILNAAQRYTGVLLADDQLYAAALTDAAGGALTADVAVVVSTVVF